MAYAFVETIRVACEGDPLVYVDQSSPGFRRKLIGKAFAYYDEKGARIRDAATLARIRALAIPPAYEDVWISPLPGGHIQATGRDARGRKQYRYHKLWSEMSGVAKFDRMARFARALPRLRERLAADLRGAGLSRRRVLATVVCLLESTLIRIGNDEYARQNNSYGLTTLVGRHVLVEGSKLRFAFKGKSGKVWRLSVTDRRIARVIRECQELPGQRLFHYVDESGETLDITSADVNAYLREISGEDITAKDFRTWAGTWLAAAALAQAPVCSSATQAKRIVNDVIREVATRLGNTPTVCRKSYIHPEIVASFLRLELKPARLRPTSGPFDLTPDEKRALAILRRAASRDAKAPSPAA